MAQKSAAQIQQELAKLFSPKDLEWRLQQVGPSKQDKDKLVGMAVPYVTNRAIQYRLDNVVGLDNWYNDYKPWHGCGDKAAQICGISIYFEERGGFITKWDGAEDSDIEPIKGGLSDSMKRAAVQWGIGRVLYSMDFIWVEAEKRGKSTIIKSSEREKLDKGYASMLEKLGLKPEEATGLQSMLTPTPSVEPEVRDGAPRQHQNQGNTAGSSPQQAPSHAMPQHQAQRGPTTPVPAIPQQAQTQDPVQQDYEYIVESAKSQPGMNGDGSTKLVLKTPEGKVCNAFARGEHPALLPGTRLKSVELLMKQQDTVVFYYLKNYQIVAAYEQAA